MKKEEWKRAILVQDKKKLSGVLGQLFVNSGETLNLLVAIEEVAREASLNPTLLDLVRQPIGEIRKKFLQLPLEKAAVVTTWLCRTIKPESLGSLLFGSIHGNEGAGVQALTRLLDIMDLYIGTDPEKAGTIVFLLICLISATGPEKSGTWGNCLDYMYRSHRRGLLERIIECFLSGGPTIFELVSMSEWTLGSMAFAKRGEFRVLRLPAPDHLTEWLPVVVRQAQRSILNHQAGLEEVTSDLRKHFDEFRAHYEDMWRDLLTRPRYCLRRDGLDAVTITMPQLRAVGYEKVSFFAKPNFPSFEARFLRVRPDLSSHFVGIELSPGDLAEATVIDDDNPARWVDHLLAFIAVSCVRRIIVGVEHIRKHKQPNGEGRNGGKRSAVVRPHMRLLPNGCKMSEEALTRALAVFVAPPPGRTFVRTYDIGEPTLSSEPLFAFNSEDLVL